MLKAMQRLLIFHMYCATSNSNYNQIHQAVIYFHVHSVALKSHDIVQTKVLQDYS